MKDELTELIITFVICFAIVYVAVTIAIPEHADEFSKPSRHKFKELSK